MYGRRCSAGKVVAGGKNRVSRTIDIDVPASFNKLRDVIV